MNDEIIKLIESNALSGDPDLDPSHSSDSEYPEAQEDYPTGVETAVGGLPEEYYEDDEDVVGPAAKRQRVGSADYEDASNSKQPSSHGSDISEDSEDEPPKPARTKTTTGGKKHPSLAAAMKPAQKKLKKRAARKFTRSILPFRKKKRH
ncbi:hypothetical protein EG329_006911 [Mollisiaceae sp. DMI_Dod_QoI]|nr:hypothetical protein EG329_006911 [Helotiales sp. DMI_Dod_QoI]